MHLIFLNNLFRTLSWSFIHSLWQGLILTILAGLIMLITRRSKASLRYGFLCVLLFLFLAGVAFTFIIEWNSGTAETSGLKFMTNLGNNDALFHHSMIRQLFEKIQFFLNTWSQWIIMIWLIILGFKLIRMMLDLIYANRLRNHNTFKPGDEWIRRLEGLGYQMGLTKKVSLMESAEVKIPGVIGYFKPVILIPAGILTSLPPAEVEAVLLHELAHIRRHDFLINFIQRIAELFFFFNPGLLWVSSLLRIERENCCDDIAIENTNDKVQFENAMISFKEYSLKQSGYVLGLFGKRNLLFRRMTRIIYNRNQLLSPVEVLFFVINFVILVLLISGINDPKVNTRPASITVAAFDERLPSVSPVSRREIQPPFKQDRSVSSKNVFSTFTGNKLPQQNIAVKRPAVNRQQITLNQEQVNEDPVMENFEQEQTGRRADKMQIDLKYEARLLRLQAETDRRQAESDREQAVKDREQAEADRIQADKDRHQAASDRHMAMKDRVQTNIDRLKAQKDREQSYNDRQQAEFERKRVEDMRQNKTTEYH